MGTPLHMNYYGRGAGRIPMPRAVTREARKEWLIHPSFIILVLAVAITFSMKITFSNKKLFKQTKTIIILPETPPLPEPTVEKKIPLIKVLKDAVKKSVEPKKLELKKITPKKPKPKPKPLKQVIPKKPEPLKLNKPAIAPKKLKIDAVKPQKRIQPKKLEVKTIAPKTVKTAKLQPKTVKPKTIAPKQIAPAAAKPNAPVAARNIAPKHKFTAMAPVKRETVANPVRSESVSVPSFSPGPVPKGPMPRLTQHSDPNRLAAAPSVRPVAAVKAAPAPRTVTKPVVAPTPGSSKVNAVSLVIQGSTIDNSGRVKNLRAAIRKKAMNMSETASPYRYRIKGYSCTVIIQGSRHKKVNIEFSPADAPFEVVSALERLLPR